MLIRFVAATVLVATVVSAAVRTGRFDMHVARHYGTADGLPSNDVRAVAIVDKSVHAWTAAGVVRLAGARWVGAANAPLPPIAARVTDSRGHVWSAVSGGVAVEGGRGPAVVLTGYQGLPYAPVTAIAAGVQGEVWLGTARGAIRTSGDGVWEYRQGLRWLPHDDVRNVAVDAEGTAWFATAVGVGSIARRPITLAEKAAFFESEIDRRHRRTPYGYVDSVSVTRPGDASEWHQHDSDNDGLWTAMYGAGECFAWGATRDAATRKRAAAAFAALRFLGTVTRGGSHPAPHGYVARTILPTHGRDPNVDDSPERDRKMQQTRDPLWKILSPRWPRSADGKWYWKADTSSDELDGHYFFYGILLRPGGGQRGREGGGARACLRIDGSPGD